MDAFMRQALAEAANGARSNDGGPFGALICRNGEVIASGHNEVLKTNDPTAHGEIVAIRKACAALGRFDLSDCVLYTSCEPCPMCLSAIYWARIPLVYYGCTKQDAADIGFDDEKIYEYLADPSQHADTLKLVPLNREECLQLFHEWNAKIDKTMY